MNDLEKACFGYKPKQEKEEKQEGIILIKFPNWQKIIHRCDCGAETKTIQFLCGIKDGENIESHIISCGICGQYVVDHNKSKALAMWNKRENLLQAEILHEEICHT